MPGSDHPPLTTKTLEDLLAEQHELMTLAEDLRSRSAEVMERLCETTQRMREEQVGEPRK